jgi:hypothetical protein
MMFGVPQAPSRRITGVPQVPSRRVTGALADPHQYRKQAHPVLMFKYRVPHGSKREQLCNRYCSNKHTRILIQCTGEVMVRALSHVLFFQPWSGKESTDPKQVYSES